VLLGLKRIVRSGSSFNLHRVRLYLKWLALVRCEHQLSFDYHSGAHVQLAHLSEVLHGVVVDHLKR
jgi:hypothetical protein